MTTIDNIRNKWNSLDPGAPCSPGQIRWDESSLSKLEKARSASSRLSARYLCYGIFSFFVTIVLIPLGKVTPLSPLLVWSYILTLVFVGVVKIYISRRIARCNVCSMPVVDAANAVIALRRLVFRLNLTCTVLSIPALIMLFMLFAEQSDKGMLIGGIIGIIIGLGFCYYHYRYLRRTFEQMAAPFSRA